MPRKTTSPTLVSIAVACVAGSLHSDRAHALDCAGPAIERLELVLESSTLDGQPSDLPLWRRSAVLTAQSLEVGNPTITVAMKLAASP